jgi:hypothetical protein
MSERALRRRVVTALKTLDAIAVENPAYPGTPDVCYIEGWIELKQVDKWTAGVLRIPHFTPQQRVWLKRRWRRGGEAYLLLQVERDWLVFDGATASEIVGRGDRRQLEEAALKNWRGLDGEKELAGWLRSRNSQRAKSYVSLAEGSDLAK